MEPAIFERFRAIIYKESGIVLPPQKLPLLSNRIQKRLRELKVQSEAEYLDIIEIDASGEELINLIDAISTNVTYFYREPEHFKLYRKILSEWKESKKQSVTVWCAAASTGEEPYTLAFEGSEVINIKSIPLRIVATDICTKVLKHAQRGQYKERDCEKIPSDIMRKYMNSIELKGEKYLQINTSIKEIIKFRSFNLVKFPYPIKGPLDIIFCRNVMIYFDTPTRAKIVKEFERILAPGGYLFLSHSENLIGINHTLSKISPSVFKKER